MGSVVRTERGAGTVDVAQVCITGTPAYVCRLPACMLQHRMLVSACPLPPFGRSFRTLSRSMQSTRLFAARLLWWRGSWQSMTMTARLRPCNGRS
jgi:hypothetical protein